MQEVYLAVGVNRSGSAVLEDVVKSAGQVIQLRNTKSFTAKEYTTPKPKVVEITGFTAKCESDYAIKVEFRNQQIYGIHGYNQFTKTFNYTTGCCTQQDCTSCPQGDCNELAVGLVNNVNADPDKLVLAELIDGPGGTVVTDPVAWSADPANAGKCLAIRLTTQLEAIRKYCSVNLKYFNPRGTNIIVSPTQGFECNGSIAVTQELRYEEGAGYDINHLEYIAGGWNGKPGPYRVSETTGVAREGFEYFATATGKYTTLSLTYDQFSVGGWLEYLNNLETIIAIPCADTTTLTSLVGVFDVLFAGRFAPLSDDVASFDCVNATPVEDINNPAQDGIESLA